MTFDRQNVAQFDTKVSEAGGNGRNRGMFGGEGGLMGALRKTEIGADGATEEQSDVYRSLKNGIWI